MQSFFESWPTTHEVAAPPLNEKPNHLHLPAVWKQDSSCFTPFIKTLEWHITDCALPRKCSPSPQDGIGSVTAYGNSKSIRDKARGRFCYGAIGWMDDFQHHNKTSLLAGLEFPQVALTHLFWYLQNLWMRDVESITTSNSMTYYILMMSKLKKKPIFYKTLMNRHTGCSAKREATLLEAMWNCFSKA